MDGTLVPTWFQVRELMSADLIASDIFFAVGILSSVAVAWTTVWHMHLSYRRHGRTFWKKLDPTAVNNLWLKWILILNNTILCIISWLYLRNGIKPSFEFFFFVVVLWVVQTQLFFQIIVNRIILMNMYPIQIAGKHTSPWMIRVPVAIYVGLINLSVFCIWIPAQLQRSETFILVNQYWDRIEKVLIMLLEVSLNVCFLRELHSRLFRDTANSSQYKSFCWANLGLIIGSAALDVVIIVVMSWRVPFLYMQLHPIFYNAKLFIENFLLPILAEATQASSAQCGMHLPSISNVAPGPASLGARQPLSPCGRLSTADSGLTDETGPFAIILLKKESLDLESGGCGMSKDKDVTVEVRHSVESTLSRPAPTAITSTTAAAAGKMDAQN